MPEDQFLKKYISSVEEVTLDKIFALNNEIEILLYEYDSMNVPDDEWKDDSKIWVTLDHLTGVRNVLLYGHGHRAPEEILEIYNDALVTFEGLAQHLSALKDFAPEYFNKKESTTVPRVVSATGKACGSSTVIGVGASTIIKNKKDLIKIITAEKVITFCGYFFPKKFREEAKGDIFETRHAMTKDGCSKLAIFFVTAFKIFSLILSSFRIRLSDLVKPENEVN